MYMGRDVRDSSLCFVLLVVAVGLVSEICRWS